MTDRAEERLLLSAFVDAAAQRVACAEARAAA